MTIEQVRKFLNTIPTLTHVAGDIDEFWNNDDISIMLTHTVWCEGEDNNNHKVLVFKRNTDEEPILLAEFTETIKNQDEIEITVEQSKAPWGKYFWKFEVNDKIICGWNETKEAAVKHAQERLKEILGGQK